ncbi:hypothetical protein ACQKNC_04270 [Lysinibacillus sp. NPDC094177]|uniref:hypothetical protein n=1 Tax=Lysinibacillus sp. NPDC094177 TaxID=3390580 RepID=UPI003D01AF39
MCTYFFIYSLCFFDSKLLLFFSGGSPEKGNSDFNIEEAITRKQIINISQTVYVAADFSKFNKDVAIQVCPVNEVDMIIRDSTPSKRHDQSFHRKRCTTENSKKNIKDAE